MYEIIGEYAEFNAERFCSDYWTKKAELKKLQIKYDAEIDATPDINTDRVKASKELHPIETTVIRRANLEYRIKNLQAYIDLYLAALKTLDSEEQAVIDAFFSPLVVGGIRSLEKQGISERRAYRLRLSAFGKIKDFVLLNAI